MEKGQEVPWRNWKLTSSDVPAAVGQEIVTGIEARTLPWFERLSSFRAIRELWLTGEEQRKEVKTPANVDLAVLEALMGNREEAKAVLSEVLRVQTHNLREQGLLDQWGDVWRRRIEDIMSPAPVTGADRSGLRADHDDPGKRNRLAGGGDQAVSQ